MNELTRLYTTILTSLNCDVRGDGSVYLKSEDSEMKPLMVNVKGEKLHLHVPYRDVQRNGDWEKIVAFHPACEGILNGQSEVINLLLNLCSLKLYTATQNAVIAILHLAADKSKHQRLRPAQHKLVTDLPPVSQSTIKYLCQILEKSTGVCGERPLLALRLYRGRKIGDVKYNRVCKLITPILDEDDPIYGIKSSGVSQQAIRTAYEIVFPTVREFGSNSNGTPYLDALLETYHAAAEHLNKLLEIMGKYPGAMKLIDVGWYQDSKNIKALGQEYLSQTYPGNTGNGISNKEESVVVPGITARMPNTYSGTSVPEPQQQSIVAVPQMAVPQPPVYQPQQYAAPVAEQHIPSLEERLKGNTYPQMIPQQQQYVPQYQQQPQYVPQHQQPSIVPPRFDGGVNYVPQYQQQPQQQQYVSRGDILIRQSGLYR